MYIVTTLLNKQRYRSTHIHSKKKKKKIQDITIIKYNSGLFGSFERNRSFITRKTSYLPLQEHQILGGYDYFGATFIIMIESLPTPL